jgi:hypothetical protein
MSGKGQAPRSANGHDTESFDCCDDAHRSKRDAPAPSCLPFRTAVTAAGMDLSGQLFVAHSHTEIIVPSGCSILLKQALASDDDIDLHIGSREIRGRVVAKLKSLKAGHVYAIEFEPSANFRWEAPFPDVAEAPPVVQLRCSACDLPGEVTLTGLDFLVYEATGAITRTCPLCHERTRWATTIGAGQPRTKASPPPPTPGGAPQRTLPVLPLTTPVEPLRTRSRDERKNARVQLKGATACVETPVRGADVVRVINMSKSGLRFVSTKRYECGDWMKVAVPYTPGGNNIFVPAEIVRVLKSAAPGLPGEYALVFRPA